MEKNANGKLKHGCSQGRGLVRPFFLEGGEKKKEDEEEVEKEKVEKEEEEKEEEEKEEEK